MDSCNKEPRKESATSELIEHSGNSQARFSKRTIKKCLYICSFAFMMNYAAYGGLVFLQSSMNIENGLGTASLFAIYATSALSTVLFVPFLIDFMGAKMAIIVGEIGITTFTIANFYPSWYTMIPAAVFHGLTESASWAGSAVYVTYLGEQYWLHSKKPSSASKSSLKKESFIYRFISVFFVFVYLSQVVGNALVCLVLYGLKDITKNIFLNHSSLTPFSGNTTEPTNNITFLPQETTDVYNGNSWQRCGAQECQSEYIYDEQSKQLKKYEPDQISIYLLLGVFLLMQLTFTSVHAFAIPKIPTKFEENITSQLVLTDVDEGKADLYIQTSPGVGLERAVKSELKETCRHFASPLHLLIFPVIFYYGVFLAFNVTEFTRAYVSCTIGVEQVGLVVMLYGSTSMLMSMLSTKLLPLLGRNVVFSAVFLMHASTYLVCLLWQPNPDSWWMIYFIASCLGSCDGTITNALQGMIAVYFDENLGIAFSVKNFANNLGIVAGTGISTLFCVYVKLYLLLGLLASSTLFYIGAEIMFRNKNFETKQKFNREEHTC